MPDNTPGRAYQRYFNGLQTAVGCISHGRLTGLSQREPELNRAYSLVLNNGDPEHLKGLNRIAFSAGQEFRVIRDERAIEGPFRATTIQYWYQFAVIDGPRLLTFHWTPETTDTRQRMYPHLHIESGLLNPDGPFNPDTFSKYHIPTERVSIEAVVRFAIEELEVRPNRKNWNTVLAEGQASFLSHRRVGLGPRQFGAER